jgi:hypothetical protein
LLFIKFIDGISRRRQSSSAITSSLLEKEKQPEKRVGKYASTSSSNSYSRHEHFTNPAANNPASILTLK